MTSPSSAAPGVAVKPQPNIYSVLLLVAIVALIVTLIFVLRTLLSPTPVGYGLSFGDLFQPLTPSGSPLR